MSRGGFGPCAVEAMIEKSLPWIMVRVPRSEAAATGSRVVKEVSRRAASPASHPGGGMAPSRASRSRAIFASRASRSTFCAASGRKSGLLRPTGSSFTSAKKAPRE